MVADQRVVRMPARHDADRYALRMEFARVLTWQLKHRGKTHRDLAAGCGWSNHTKIYPWTNGTSEPKPEQIWAMEACLKLDPGTLSRPLGYVPADGDGDLPEDVQVVADAWPLLPEEAKRVILNIVAEFTPAEAIQPRRRRR